HRARTGPSPDAYFALKLGDRALDVSVNTRPDPNDGWDVEHSLAMPMTMDHAMSMSRSLGQPSEADLDYPRAEGAWLVDSLSRRVRALGEVDHGFTLVVGDAERAPRVFAYTLMPTSWGDTMVYGARYSTEAFGGILASVLDAPGLLPSAFSEGRR